MLFSFHRLVAPALIPLILTKITVADDVKSRAETAFYTLQDWYNDESGIWDTCGWWNGANVMNAVADLAMVDSSVRQTANYVFNNTYYVAPAASNPKPGPEVKTVFQRDLSTRGGHPGNASDWLDSAYDDDGWWALAWIAAYDATNEGAYLELAEGIFAGLKAAWGTHCDGAGIPWNPTSTYVNSITNELFLSVAAYLSNRVKSKKEYYTQWAQTQWDWFSAQGFLGENNTINDGLLDNCKNNGDTVWSYNQGVVLGGLVELNKASPNRTYLESANTIAKAAIETLTDSNMVVHESCEVFSCEPDATQFKGIFIRNLAMLQRASPNPKYKEVIQKSASSIWDNDRNSHNQFGVNWAGPIHDKVDASTHSSALEALIASITIEA